MISLENWLKVNKIWKKKVLMMNLLGIWLLHNIYRYHFDVRSNYDVDLDIRQAALDFTTSMGHCVPMAVEMMRSKVVSDVLESIEFICVAKLFGIDGAERAISKSLSLVWSQDERLRNAVVSTYVRLYLTNHGQLSKKDHAKLVVNNLLHIISTATSGELASLEKLVGLFISGSHIPDLALKELWQIYHKNIPERGSLESVLSCQLLSMAIPIDMHCSSLSSNLDRMMSSGLVQLNGE